MAEKPVFHFRIFSAVCIFITGTGQGRAADTPGTQRKFLRHFAAEINIYSYADDCGFNCSRKRIYNAFRKYSAHFFTGNKYVVHPLYAGINVKNAFYGAAYGNGGDGGNFSRVRNAPGGIDKRKIKTCSAGGIKFSSKTSAACSLFSGNKHSFVKQTIFFRRNCTKPAFCLRISRIDYVKIFKANAGNAQIFHKPDALFSKKRKVFRRACKCNSASRL